MAMMEVSYGKGLQMLQYLLVFALIAAAVLFFNSGRVDSHMVPP